MQAEMDRLLVAKHEAARLLGVSASTVDNLRKRGELRGVKLGRRRLFSVAELRELVARKGANNE